MQSVSDRWTTYGALLPDELQQRLRRIDDTTRELHWHLSSNDEVLYWREYTSGKDYTFSDTNQFIGNLKKEPSRPEGQLKHKRAAIARASAYFSAQLNPKWLDIATLVPMPCSKKADHPDYDDRMTQVCRGIRYDGGKRPDVRELIKSTKSMTAAHRRTSAEGRPKVTDLEAIYAIDETLVDKTPRLIGVVDDIITAGTHFRAVSNLLTRRFPNATITGLFVARRVFPPERRVEFDVLD